MPGYPRRPHLRPLRATSVGVLLAGCASGPANEASSCELSGPHIVAATSDFRVGALAAITPDGCVADKLSSTSGDAVVRATSERLWVLNRTGGDALLAYPHGDYRTPELEIGAYRHDNPHDLVRVGDQLFLTLYERSELVVLDAADGSELGTIDLSPEADADGLPEADALRVRDGKLYVSLQRLDRSEDAWIPSDHGAVLQLNPDSWAVERRWETDGNPRMTTFGREIAVMSGAYFKPDGWMYVLDTHMEGAEALQPLISEADVQLDLAGGAGGVVLGTDFEEGGDSVIGCVAGQRFVEGRRGAAWFADALDARELGMGVLVAARKGWWEDAPGGLLTVEPDGCVVADIQGSTLLDPFSLAMVP